MKTRPVTATIVRDGAVWQAEIHAPIENEGTPEWMGYVIAGLDVSVDMGVAEDRERSAD